MTTAIATTAATAILPAALFLGAGGLAKLLWLPHVGHDDKNDPYLLPHTAQSIQESAVWLLPHSWHAVQHKISCALCV
jgi:hypothetical protein